MARPMASVARIASQIGMSCPSIRAIAMLQKPTTAPTERSMPAVMMTKVSPIARIAIIEPWRARLAMLFSVQKVVVAKDSTIHISTQQAEQREAEQQIDAGVGALSHS